MKSEDKGVQFDERAPRGWSVKQIAETFAAVSGLSEAEHRAQVSAAMFGVFDEVVAKHAAMVGRAIRRAAALIECAKSEKAADQVQHDNIATPGAPVWRRRLRKPYTCWAVRMELVKQSADLPDGERQLYVRRRLTELDKALTDDEAEAIERYLDCEEMLCGRVQISDYGDRVGGGSGEASPVPNDWLRMLDEHAQTKRRMSPEHRAVMVLLGRMMDAPQWDYAQAGRILGGVLLRDDRQAKRRFINAVQGAAEFLAAQATGRKR